MKTEETEGGRMNVSIKDPALSVDTEAIEQFLVRYGVSPQQRERLRITLQPSGWLRWFCRGYCLGRRVGVYTGASPNTHLLNRVLRHELGHVIEGTKGRWYTVAMMCLIILIAAAFTGVVGWFYNTSHFHPAFLALPLLVECWVYKVMFDIQYKYSPIERAARRYEQEKDHFIRLKTS